MGNTEFLISLSSLPPADDLQCIHCDNELAWGDLGYLCANCGASYPLRKGIPVFISPDSLHRAKVEDAHWLRHPVEGPDKPARWSISHKNGYIHFFTERILDRFDFRGKILEIGAGSCWASAMVKRFNPDCRLYSTDISVQALWKGLQVCQILKATMDYVAACDAHDLPFKNGLFDMVFGVAILHHLEHPKDALKEVWRVLKPGGLYVGVREGLAGESFKPLYRLLSHGWEEERRFGAVERAYSYKEWSTLLSDFDTELRLKRGAKLGLNPIEKAYYALVNLLPESMLRHTVATLEIAAKKPCR